MQLLSVQTLGAVYAVILLAICAAAVHLFRLVRFGYRAMKKKPTAKKPPEPSPEPVYYIVERKKKKPRSDYSEPRRFQFK